MCNSYTLLKQDYYPAKKFPKITTTKSKKQNCNIKIIMYMTHDKVDNYVLSQILISSEEKDSSR